ncbi:unnamed protein product [Didymodactylos carnosus]|uniref:Sulfhydryl oxidase n=1 Tax=Didymodactylos carnosus TaxID=1234261 RepID=A0A814R7H5_9BILA|nr:unnamed protein product [Didymodactylos carnosus]CAF1128755.1 unnamed protein product [Didymodactylos carnosus]CAF3804576.1 unnamed protein product [Didymodactylos carnosus]CAF3892350.1 unnamed protein product [Didymodactylos carnosus]
MFNNFVDSDSSGYQRRPPSKRTSLSNIKDESPLAGKYRRKAERDDDDPSKPCKACVDFKDWMRHSSTTNTNSENSQNEDRSQQQILSISSDCPLMRDDLGRASWSLLHTIAAYYPKSPKSDDKQTMKEFISAFSKLFPCPECREDFQEEILKDPPDLSDRLSLSKWFCNQHNLVNKKLGKPSFDCEKVLERWKTGPEDGRCD